MLFFMQKIIKKNCANQGHTLVELLVVVLIVSMLTSFGAVSLATHFRQQSYDDYIDLTTDFITQAKILAVLNKTQLVINRTTGLPRLHPSLTPSRLWHLLKSSSLSCAHSTRSSRRCRRHRRAKNSLHSTKNSLYSAKNRITLAASFISRPRAGFFFGGGAYGGI